MLIYPAEQRVIVLPEKQKATLRESGIIIPPSVADNKPEVAEVIVTGTGSSDNPMEYSVGQKVIYSQYAGVEVKLNINPYGEQVYKIMNQLDIMAIVRLID